MSKCISGPDNGVYTVAVTSLLIGLDGRSCDHCEFIPHHFSSIIILWSSVVQWGMGDHIHDLISYSDSHLMISEYGSQILYVLCTMFFLFFFLMFSWSLDVHSVKRSYRQIQRRFHKHIPTAISSAVMSLTSTDVIRALIPSASLICMKIAGENVAVIINSKTKVNQSLFQTHI